MSAETVVDLALDVNSTATISTVVGVSNVDHVGFHMKEASGNHAGVVWRLYCSPDSSNWFRTVQLTQAQVNTQDTAELFDCRGAEFIRFQVDTASGVAGTEDITVTI